MAEEIYMEIFEKYNDTTLTDEQFDSWLSEQPVGDIYSALAVVMELPNWDNVENTTFVSRLCLELDARGIDADEAAVHINRIRSVL